jgi:UDP-N-acetylmuramyl pentapeptide phosphotransferase/UDP-N-acetylglucosamine-1-phosphate transferase
MAVALGTLAAFATSAVFVFVFFRIARQRLLDQPGARSSHVRPTPTGGGIALLAAWLVVSGACLALGVLSHGRTFWVAAASAALLGVVGLLDDLHDLPRSARYAVQLAVAAGAVSFLGVPSLGPLPAWLVYPAAIVGFTYLVNAFNFMDGIDALVAGTGAIILGFLAYFSGNPAWLVLAGAYLGFLIHNLPPARLFMGDAGSTALGALVSVALLAERAALRPAELLVLGPLIGDSAYTLMRRLLRGENVFQAHHSHIYQRLLRAGHSHGRISAGYALATLAIGCSIALFGDAGAWASLLALVLSLLGAEAYLERQKVPFTRAARPIPEQNPS